MASEIIKLAIVLLVLLGPTSHFTIHKHTDIKVPPTDILGRIFTIFLE
jgi:hypothetical protein